MTTTTFKAIRRAVGAALGIGGILTLLVPGKNVIEMLRVLRHAAASGQLSILLANVGLDLVFLYFSVACIVSGIQLLRNRQSRGWLLLSGLVPQFFSVIVSGFQYRFIPAVFLGLSAHSDGELVKIGAFAYSGTQVAVGFDPVENWAIQVNLAAVALGAMLLLPKLWPGPAGPTKEPRSDATAEPANEPVGPAAGRS